ncbi:hypothetical protein R3P38DRAFT_63174 [Favolaschia claudopus]|uniref:Uncharacterized protein n=1 Tax=Favolaschia claudopus TaxID=2862362 RepID=A0AAW0EJK7_9AGAR
MSVSPAQLPLQVDNNIGGASAGKSDSDGPSRSLSAQQQAQIAALLNFRPSSRDVISGIAPHVFEDQRYPWRSSPRSRNRRRGRTPSSERRPGRRSGSGSRTSKSPLRLSAVISLDVDEQGQQQHRGEENLVLGVYTAPAPRSHTSCAPSLLSLAPPVTPSTDGQDVKHIPKSKRGGFRIDRVFKTFVFRLK